MANIANVRSFNGTSDKIQFATTGLLVTPSAASWVCLVKPDEQAITRAIISMDGGTGAEWTFQISPTEFIDFWSETDTATSTGGYVLTEVWQLLAFTKADGIATPRFHRYRYDTQVWDHTDDDETFADFVAPAGANLWMGAYTGSSEWYGGEIACVGVWLSTALSDANLETMTVSIASWEALSPTALWLLNQSSTATPVPDRIGDADETALTGTTAITESALAFDVGGVASTPKLRALASPLRW